MSELSDLKNENKKLKLIARTLSNDFVNFFILSEAKLILESDETIFNAILDGAIRKCLDQENVIQDLTTKLNVKTNELSQNGDFKKAYYEIKDRAYFYDLILTAIELNPALQAQWINLMGMIKLFSDENIKNALEGKNISFAKMSNIFGDPFFEQKKLINDKNLLSYKLEMANKEIETLKNTNKNKNLLLYKLEMANKEIETLKNANKI